MERARLGNVRHGNGRFLCTFLKILFYQICILKPLSERTPILVCKNKSFFFLNKSPFFEAHPDFLYPYF